MSSKTKSPTSPSQDKVRVKFLVDTTHGKKNEITLISKALWTNVLEPKRQAVKISDDEIAKMKQEAENAATSELALLQDFSLYLSTQSLSVERKVGANGQLFGSVTGKAIQEIFHKFPSKYHSILENKHFQIIDIFEYSSEDGSINRSQSLSEIRRQGKYRLKIHVGSKVDDVELDLSIVPQPQSSTKKE